MARTFTLKPYIVRQEVYPVSAVAVAPDATTALATTSALAYNPAWLVDLTEVKVQYDFIGSVTDAGSGSNPQMQMVADFGGTNAVRGQSIVLALGVSLALPFSWRFRGEAPDAPAFANGSVLQLQGLNPSGAGNVSFDGFLTLSVFAQEAP